MSRHQHAQGVRLGFAEAPDRVRTWAGRQIGGELIAVTDCVGGMSPGPAARIGSSAGATAFVKTCGPELNPITPELLRDEARILAVLPAHPNLPRLLDVYDDGDWVALLIEDLPGGVPDVPWSADDLRRASDVLSAVRPVLGRVASNWVPLAIESPIFADGWKLLADRLDQVDPWWAKHHDELASHAERAVALIDGDALLHWDVRADNLIFGTDRDVLVDWGQVRRGAEWMDPALLAMDCAMSGSTVSAAADFFAEEPVLADRDPSDLTSLMAAAAMTFAARAMDEPPPGLPTIQATRARWAENLRRELDKVL
ncbi:hypothetical protein GCM10011492_03400 [Flexivirga endophytica]|uniref:Protein kinase domain-containing protein n=1 Tax=Flexivirga endophytica TaxID=1849103 RepID=A0A916ST84_9MICO|nr:hypothetical protein [Flexivirga endophytica]GGB16953.1 hypothetical protein GCM10011492_03400 [Flexivirga endophytica]GHB38602.1 hypothetical protein GCM10008112_04210 [Flexivirga endophytica]